jgi:YidC/Oxa1 family membrane protein insertase
VLNPPIDDSDGGAATTARVLNVALPLMIGWFSLNVPSGLALYYMANTVMTLAVQLYLKKLGGADVSGLSDRGRVGGRGVRRSWRCGYSLDTTAGYVLERTSNQAVVVFRSVNLQLMSIA